jgi:putative pyruvate formate lyase activating enzyme
MADSEFRTEGNMRQDMINEGNYIRPKAGSEAASCDAGTPPGDAGTPPGDAGTAIPHRMCSEIAGTPPDDEGTALTAEEMAFMHDNLSDCTLCHRACHVDRLSGSLGFCRMDAGIHIARSSLHFWEEPCLAGEGGSGAIFFEGCSLGCVYCQNRSISGVDPHAHGVSARSLTVAGLADEMLRLQSAGAENIDLVTPTHFIPQIALAASRARSKGLSLPIVYNTGTYEAAESIGLLKGYVDIWMPDLKYYSSELSDRYSHAPDYFSAAAAAISSMYDMCGPAVMDAEGRMKSGILVRHMVLPGHTRDSMAVLRYLHDTYGDNSYISIMRQYTPMPGVADLYPELGRRVTDREYDKVLDYAIGLGITNAFIQDKETAKESFIPDFTQFH